MSKLLGDAYTLLDEMAAFIDDTMAGDHPRRDEIEDWLKAYEKQDVEHDEVLDRVRRIETRLCVLMEHAGVVPNSNGTYG